MLSKAFGIDVLKLHHPAHAADFGRGGMGLRWRSIWKYLQVVRKQFCWAGRRFFGANGCGKA